MELWSLLSGNSIEATPLEALHHSADLQFMHLMHSLKNQTLTITTSKHTMCHLNADFKCMTSRPSPFLNLILIKLGQTEKEA